MADLPSDWTSTSDPNPEQPENQVLRLLILSRAPAPPVSEGYYSDASTHAHPALLPGPSLHSDYVPAYPPPATFFWSPILPDAQPDSEGSSLDAITCTHPALLPGPSSSSQHLLPTSPPHAPPSFSSQFSSHGFSSGAPPIGRALFGSPAPEEHQDRRDEIAFPQRPFGTSSVQCVCGGCSSSAWPHAHPASLSGSSYHSDYVSPIYPPPPTFFRSPILPNPQPGSSSSSFHGFHTTWSVLPEGPVGSGEMPPSFSSGATPIGGAFFGSPVPEEHLNQPYQIASPQRPPGTSSVQCVCGGCSSSAWPHAHPASLPGSSFHSDYISPIYPPPPTFFRGPVLHQPSFRGSSSDTTPSPEDHRDDKKEDQSTQMNSRAQNKRRKL